MYRTGGKLSLNPRDEGSRVDLFAAMRPLKTKQALFAYVTGVREKRRDQGLDEVKLMCTDVKKGHLNAKCEEEEWVELWHDFLKILELRRKICERRVQTQQVGVDISITPSLQSRSQNWGRHVRSCPSGLTLRCTASKRRIWTERRTRGGGLDGDAELHESGYDGRGIRREKEMHEDWESDTEKLVNVEEGIQTLEARGEGDVDDARRWTHDGIIVNVHVEWGLGSERKSTSGGLMMINDTVLKHYSRMHTSRAYPNNTWSSRERLGGCDYITTGKQHLDEHWMKDKWWCETDQSTRGVGGHYSECQQQRGNECRVKKWQERRDPRSMNFAQGGTCEGQRPAGCLRSAGKLEFLKYLRCARLRNRTSDGCMCRYCCSRVQGTSRETDKSAVSARQRKNGTSETERWLQKTTACATEDMTYDLNFEM